MSGPYLVHERGQYEPPACPGCLKRHYVQWCETTSWAEAARGEKWYLPGRNYCRTTGCVYNDQEQAR